MSLFLHELAEPRGQFTGGICPGSPLSGLQGRCDCHLLGSKEMTGEAVPGRGYPSVLFWSQTEGQSWFTLLSVFCPQSAVTQDSGGHGAIHSQAHLRESSMLGAVKVHQ